MNLKGINIMNDSNLETKMYVCKKCGRKLPLEKMVSKNANGKIYVWVCKDCKNEMLKEKRKQKNIELFMQDDSMKIRRKYKNVRSERILSINECGITFIASDEVFVKLIDYRDAWISNYGRALTLYGGKYSVMHRKNVDGEIAYKLYKNVYDGKKWIYEKQLVKAWTLVVQEFIVNYDIINNVCCWHRCNNKDDLYYKNLYPLNEKQYAAVQEKFEIDRIDSEESIMDVINSVEYKADNWSPQCMKRSVCGIGYLGCNKVDILDKAYRKWANMIQRCYYDKIHEYKPYYAPCTVCEEWLNFSNFKVWYDENNIKGRKFDLDKDILIQGNMEYAPDTCALVSHYTNTIFESRGIESNIVLNSKTGMYDTSMILLGKRKEVGSFGTREIAQKELFEYKKDYIRQFARKSKRRVQNKVYQAMMNWQVEAIDQVNEEHKNTMGLSA